MILKIRIVLDHDDKVFRDIEIEDKGSLEDLHHFILEAFALDEGEMASFYQSDEQWNKGGEIALLDMGTSDEPVELMSEAPLNTKTALRERLLYVYDFLNLRIFYVETIDALKKEKGVSYPRIIMAYGEMPKSENSFDLESLLEGIDPVDKSKEHHAIEDDLDVWDESDDTMDNIDDYEGLI